MEKKNIAIVGSQEFTLGFKLTGIKTIINPTNASEEVKQLLTRKEIGVVLMDEGTMEQLNEIVKEEVIASLNPIFVVISATAQQEALRKMILQSIGVDLLKEETK